MRSFFDLDLDADTDSLGQASTATPDAEKTIDDNIDVNPEDHDDDEEPDVENGAGMIQLAAAVAAFTKLTDQAMLSSGEFAQVVLSEERLEALLGQMASGSDDTRRALLALADHDGGLSRMFEMLEGRALELETVSTEGLMDILSGIKKKVATFLAERSANVATDETVAKCKAAAGNSDNNIRSAAAQFQTSLNKRELIKENIGTAINRGEKVIPAAIMQKALALDATTATVYGRLVALKAPTSRAEYDEWFKKAGELINPLVDFYGFQIRDDGALKQAGKEGDFYTAAKSGTYAELGYNSIAVLKSLAASAGKLGIGTQLFTEVEKAIRATTELQKSHADDKEAQRTLHRVRQFYFWLATGLLRGAYNQAIFTYDVIIHVAKRISVEKA